MRLGSAAGTGRRWPPTVAALAPCGKVVSQTRTGNSEGLVWDFFDLVGRERCYISLFDDLRADPAAAYLRLLDFLGLEDDGYRDFRPQRRSRGFRFGWLQRLLKRPSFLTGSALAGEAFLYRLASGPAKPPSLGFRALMKVRGKLLQWNERPAPKAELPPELQPEIRDLLVADVRDLSQLIGRDLSHWLGGIEASGKSSSQAATAPIKA